MLGNSQTLKLALYLIAFGQIFHTDWASWPKSL